MNHNIYKSNLIERPLIFAKLHILIKFIELSRDNVTNFSCERLRA